MTDLDDHAPDEISCPSQVFDIAFHPLTNVVALGSVDGIVQVYKYSEETNSKILELRNHQEAVRALLFAPDGQSTTKIVRDVWINASYMLPFSLYTSSADKSIRAFDTLGNPIWAEMRAHELVLTTTHVLVACFSHPVNRLHELSANVFASGDDQGCIKIWDTRQHRCLAKFKEHTDYISGFATNPANDHLLATSGDGRLSAYDLRKNVLAGKSDELDDELLSVAVIKNGRKIVCGSQDGVLVIFSWETWGDMSDRFPGHPDSVEALLKVDEDTVLTGSSDGIVRVVQLHPNKLLGLIGDHEDFPVEVLKFSHDKRIIGSTSHTNKVHFWDVGYLFDLDDDVDVDTSDKKEETGASSMTVDTEMQEAESDSDSEDSDMGNAARGRRVFATASEKFFADL
ncbi:hypothetical protein PsorP6_011507 [Peronosclerospora sorghi]|uniref:Uncharacterized protein n=1 Tax=Peronosclerospora sorghi TaxID=230839 RepID=A0ACC0WHY3_9STRA|nr:hypothetical protein PsorP6_011507 [Peronosclerospora sorghi]